MISKKHLIKACCLGLAFLIIGSNPVFLNYVSASDEKSGEKVTTTFSGEMDYRTNTETISMTASAAADNVIVTGIKLPDGSIVEGSDASFEVHENGDYNFTVLFEETKVDVNTISPVDTGKPVPDSSVRPDSDEESNVSPSIPEPISPIETPLFPEETDLPQGTPSSEDILPFSTGSQMFTYTVDQLSSENRTVVQDGYEFDKTTKTIIGYQGTADMSGDIIIPVQIDGTDVLHIGDGVFENKGLTTVVFPKNDPDAANNSKVETIGESTFADNLELYNVEFPSSLRSIGIAAFQGCKKLGMKTSGYVQIIIPDSVTEIGEYAFNNCTSLGRVRLSRGMNTIKSNTFRNTSISYLEIPESITTIEEGAFQECSSTEFTILGKSIGEITGAPWGVMRATVIWKVSRPEDEIKEGPWVYSISQEAVVEYKGLGGKDLTIPSSFTKDGTSYPVKKIGEMIFSARRVAGPPFGLDITGITIPEGVTTIGAQAFGSCNQLQRVSLPVSLRSIGEQAFYLNQKLQRITLPDNLTYIGKSTFRESGLQGTIRIPGGVKRISNDAFFYTKLTGVEMAEGVTTIGDGAFKDTAIKNVVLPASLVNVEKGAFGYTVTLKNITFPGVVRTIASNAFAGCSNMIINLPANNPDSVPDRPWGAKNSVIKWMGGTILPPPPPVPTNDWEFDRYRRTLTKYLGNDKNVVIPDVIKKDGKNYPVEHLGDRLFSRRPAGSTVPIESITIPEGVLTIGNFALAALLNLESVKLPSTLTTIKNAGFQSCSSLKTLILPESVKLLGDSVFENSGIEHITIPGGVEAIPASAFKSSRLVSITLSEGVKSIGEFAFLSTRRLEKVRLPLSLEKIDMGAFRNNPYLRQIIIPGRLPNDGIDETAFWTSSSIRILFLQNEKGTVAGAPWSRSPATVIDWNTTVYSDWTYDKGTKTITGYTGSDKKVRVPSTLIIDGITYPVEKLGEGVFRDNKVITDVEVSLGITSIGNSTFENAVNLIRVGIPESLKTVESRAFSNCRSLNEIVFTDATTTIAADAFERCSGIEIFLPGKDVDSIPNAPWGAADVAVSWKGQEKITNSNWEYSKLDKAVMRYKGTDAIVTVPDTFTDGGKSYPVKVIARRSFSGKKTIREVIVPEGITMIQQSAFYGSSMTKIGLPASLINIEARAFDGAGELVSIDIPEGVRFIGESAFEDCVKLTRVKLPNTLTVLEAFVFQACRNLISVTVPASVNYVQGYAFFLCSSLTEIRFPGEVTRIGFGAFDVCNSLTDIYLKKVPKDSISGAPWGTNTAKVHWYSDIIVSDDREWEYSISNKRVTKYLGRSSVISVPEFIVEGSKSYPVNGIATETFDTKKDTITQVSLPNSLQYIMDSVFEDCVNLTKVDFSVALKWIGQSAFKGCTSLKAINMEALINLTEIGNSAFEGCSSLSSITIPGTVARIGDRIFASSINLETVIMKKGVQSIGVSAFESTKLSTISIPDSVQSVGENAFKNCMELGVVELGSNRSKVNSIGSNTFSGCTNLKLILVKQVITDTDIYKNQPWGAPNPRVIVKYIGEKILFESYIVKKPNSYERILNIWGKIEKGIINNVLLPGNQPVFGTGGRTWGDRTNPNKIPITSNGRYIIKGYDSNLEETVYVVEISGIGVPQVTGEDAKITLEEVNAATKESILTLVKARGIADNDKPLPVTISEAELNKVKALSNHGDRATITLTVTDPDPSSGLTATRDVTLTLDKGGDSVPDPDVELPTPPIVTPPTPPVVRPPVVTPPMPPVVRPPAARPTPTLTTPAPQQVVPTSAKTPTINADRNVNESTNQAAKSGEDSTGTTEGQNEENRENSTKSKDNHKEVKMHKKPHFLRFMFLLAALGVELIVIVRRNKLRREEAKRKIQQ